MKKLVVGDDYISCYYISDEQRRGRALIYEGKDSWLGIDRGKQRRITSRSISESIVRDINGWPAWKTFRKDDVLEE